MDGAEDKPRILLVDDEDQLLRAWVRYFERKDWMAHGASDGREALAFLAEHRYDAIVSDITMPELDGIELLRKVRELDPDVPVLLTTGSPNIDTAIQAVDFGAFRYLTKPVPIDELFQLVERASQLGRLARAKRSALALAGGGEIAGDRAGLEASFQRCLDKLWMAYQPIIRASDKSLFAFEALVRSDEPTLPHPGAILGAADRLDRHNLLASAIRHAASRPFAESPQGSLLFMNLRAKDLEDPALLTDANPLVALAPRVVLEITERESLESVPESRNLITRLREIGFRIAIDDLGAGYAGLTSFALLEPEFVKIDMSLVRDIDQQATKRKLVRSMTLVCHDLGMPVIAEGIETAAERDVCIELGCDLLQGYLHARPGRPFPEFRWG
jgi:EAL domain-containing protein (putative c-di-GMP-specific phosphodiesterase class I)/ActR/RegA family two-component response regulator